MGKLKLYKHQQELVDYNKPRLLVAWEPGTGKTAAAIARAEKYGKFTNIICPKNIVENWEDELRLWQASFAYKITTKERFKINQTKGEFTGGPFHTIIDEAHYFSGRTSQLFKSALEYLDECKQNGNLTVDLLTGTPFMSTYWNIWALAKLLGYELDEKKFEQMFYRFKDLRYWPRKNKLRATGDFEKANQLKEFYDTRREAYTLGIPWRDVIPSPRPNMKDKMVEMITRIGVTKRLDECVDMPPAVYEREFFDLNKKQIEKIQIVDQMLDDDGNPLIPAVRNNYLHQIGGGSFKKEGWWGETEKSKRCIELAVRHKKLIIVCAYLLELRVIQEDLERIYPRKKIFIIQGGENATAIAKLANAEEECIVLIINACSEGYNLSTFDTMVFYSQSYSLKDYIQIQRRIQRANNPHRCLYISLLNRGSIDEAVYRCVVINKMDFNNKIYEGRK